MSDFLTPQKDLTGECRGSRVSLLCFLCALLFKIPSVGFLNLDQSIVSITLRVMRILTRSVRSTMIAAVLALLGTSCSEEPRGDKSTAATGNASAPLVKEADSPVFDSGDWPLFRGNALGTGVAESALPERLELLWKYKLPDTSI